jgi:hypothetical protein
MFTDFSNQYSINVARTRIYIVFAGRWKDCIGQTDGYFKSFLLENVFTLRSWSVLSDFRDLSTITQTLNCLHEAESVLRS